ncbi:hypothetical protein M9458_048522, partial [Cirrhinus mrigala]
MKESIKDAIVTLGTKWAKQLEQTKDPEAAFCPRFATISPSLSTPVFSPVKNPTASSTSGIINRLTDGEVCAIMPAGPDSISERIEVQEHQGFYVNTKEKHHERLKYLLQILEAAWWPTICSNVWMFIRGHKSCDVETKECTVIKPSRKPPHSQQHHRPSSKETLKLDWRKCQ